MPREFLAGGVLDCAGSTQKCSWGNVMTSITPVTCSFIINLRAAGSSSFDVVWGYSAARWFFVLNGTNTRRLAFNCILGGVERSSGYITSNLSLNTFYYAVASYDPSGGANNHFIEVYNMDGTLYSSSTATNTGTFTATGNSLVAGYDSVRTPGLPVNAQFKNFRVHGRVLTGAERLALAANEEVSRANLELESLCNESATPLVDTATIAHARPGTLSGGATISPNVPTEFARSRNLIV